MSQILGCISEGTAAETAKIKYWVETRSPEKQVLLRKSPTGWEQVILTAPVIVLIRDKGHVQARYLTGQECTTFVKEFTDKYTLNPQQRAWCDATLATKIEEDNYYA